jgi:hypothetical protein
VKLLTGEVAQVWKINHSTNKARNVCMPHQSVFITSKGDPNLKLSGVEKTMVTWQCSFMFNLD